MQISFGNLRFPLRFDDFEGLFFYFSKALLSLRIPTLPKKYVRTFFSKPIIKQYFKNIIPAKGVVQQASFCHFGGPLD